MSGGNIGIMTSIFGSVALVGTACVLHCRLIRCDDLIEAPVRSPDGRWVVTSATKACPAGFLSSTNYSIVVTLVSESAGSSVKTALKIFEERDAAEPATLTWASGNDLLIRVNEAGIVETSLRGVGDVRIRYAVPKRVWDSLGSVESDRLRDERESEELYKAGKLNRGDLRVSREVTESYAKEQSNFRQWTLDNATVEE